MITCDAVRELWGPYVSYDDIARFEYGRMLWQRPETRARLLAHWLDPRHPYRERFLAQRELIEAVLNSQKSEAALQRDLLARDTSLRCVAREIPPVFGSFWSDSLRSPGAERP